MATEKQRGRPVNADAAATRQRILDAGTDLFSEKGLGTTSVRQIAQASGLSVAMIGHYFGGKDALHSACLDAMYRDLATVQNELLPVFAGGGDRRQVLADTVRTMFRFGREHHKLVRLALRSVIDSGRTDPARRATGFDALLGPAAAALSTVLGRSERELRLALQSMTIVISRYAITDVDELRIITGLPDASDAEVLETIQDHLVSLAQRALGMGSEGSPR